jgi:hypothetical protein
MDRELICAKSPNTFQRPLVFYHASAMLTEPAIRVSFLQNPSISAVEEVNGLGCSTAVSIVVEHGSIPLGM